MSVHQQGMPGFDISLRRMVGSEKNFILTIELRRLFSFAFLDADTYRSFFYTVLNFCFLTRHAFLFEFLSTKALSLFFCPALGFSNLACFVFRFGFMSEEIIKFWFGFGLGFNSSNAGF